MHQNIEAEQAEESQIEVELFLFFERVGVAEAHECVEDEDSCEFIEYFKSQHSRIDERLEVQQVDYIDERRQKQRLDLHEQVLKGKQSDNCEEDTPQEEEYWVQKA